MHSFLFFCKLQSMKTLVIYNSQTGFTEKYAKWLAEKLEAKCLSVKEAKNEKLADYDRVIFGSWFCAESISKLNWFLPKIGDFLKDVNKKIAIFGCGASPIENPDLKAFFQKTSNTIEEKFSQKFDNLGIFYCPGGLNYEKMNTASKIAMKMFVKMLDSKKNKTEKDEIMVKRLSSSYDISDKRHIEAILEFVK